MTEKIYRIDITPAPSTENDGHPIANAFGSLAVINYVAKDALKGALKDFEGAVSLALVEVEHIGGNVVRTVTELTADADTVRYVLERGLRAEKKAGSVESAPAFENGEPADKSDDATTEAPVEGSHTEF